MGSNSIKPGTKFMVPTKEQLLAAGWVEKGSGLEDGNTHLKFFKSQLDYSGQILTAEQSASLSYWSAEDTAHQIWPVQACLDICGVIKDDVLDALKCITASPSFSFEKIGSNPTQAGTYEEIMKSEYASDCNCEAGSTPLGGFIICKHCGKDLHKVGS